MAPTQAGIERRRLGLEARLQHLQPRRLHLVRDMAPQRGRGRARARAVLEREGLREADLLDQPHGRREVGIALAGKADDEIRRQRQIWPGRRAGRRRRADSRRRCSARFIASSTASEPDCTGRCRNGISCGKSRWARIRSSVHVARMRGGVAQPGEARNLGQRPQQAGQSPGRRRPDPRHGRR